MNNERNAEILNDLLHITNDRIAGFETVEGQVWESYSDLKGEYDRMISESKIMKNDLINLIQEDGKTADDSASAAGAIHRTWIDLKNSFVGGSKEKSTLENVVYGEQNAIKAYEDVLASGELNTKSAKIVEDQLYLIRQSYTKFKNIEDYKKK
ncbi:PA2169 family four-helix-bundle protein [Chryseobacterium wangxinyae]|uniref:PA2169 family four-helix-bundle protein n=1 Tax=Chryseobacterium sp. CY350 TaxID=2997336 RepID=UPI00226FCA32|nr:PA2169 family four-helix-bundle protein [Chryseobacterium sp. CY350]MCY0976755.1 PA2169 family four-helix-bundle protein [Chryseobacterium sp. CY350]WBZ96756.1 PA2169 family four-helix-bundle protein [Chryseobacterium sp. CY350]